MGRSASERRKLLSQVRLGLASDLNEDEQLDLLGTFTEKEGYEEVSIRELRTLQTEALNTEVERYTSATPEELYARYKLRQDAVVGELDGIVKFVNTLPPKSRGPGMVAAAVSALKVKSDIIRQTFEKGVDLNIISGVTSEKLLVGGVPVMEVTITELKREIKVRTARLNALATSVGGVDYLDVSDEEEIYYSLGSGDEEEDDEDAPDEEESRSVEKLEAPIKRTPMAPPT